MTNEPDSLRRRADQLRAILRGVTDARAIEVLKGEIADLERKARQIEAARPRKP